MIWGLHIHDITLLRSILFNDDERIIRLRFNWYLRVFLFHCLWLDALKANFTCIANCSLLLQYYFFVFSCKGKGKVVWTGHIERSLIRIKIAKIWFLEQAYIVFTFSDEGIASWSSAFFEQFYKPFRQYWLLIFWLVDGEFISFVLPIFFLFKFLEGTHRLFPQDGFWWLLILLGRECERRVFKDILFFKILSTIHNRNDNTIGQWHSI